MYCTCLWRQPRLHTPRTPSPRLPTVGQDFVILIITAAALVHPSQPLPSPATPNSSPSVFWSLGKIMTSVNRPIVIASLRSMYGLAEIHQSSLLVAKVSIRSINDLRRFDFCGYYSTLPNLTTLPLLAYYFLRMIQGDCDNDSVRSIFLCYSSFAIYITYTLHSLLLAPHRIVLHRW